jgi:hypothetical protein
MPILTVPVAGQYGVILDQQAQELPVNAWSRAVNIRFKDGCAERIEGDAQIFTSTSVIPYYIDAYQSGATRYHAHAGIASVYVDDGTTRTNITPVTPFTGAIDDRWSGGTLGGILIMNNNKEAPQYWGGNVANKLVALTGWPASTTAGFIRPWKNILVAGDITESTTRYPSMIRTSVPAVPGSIPTSWDYTDATKTSIRRDLAEEPSILVDALPWGDALFIYKERAVYAMQIGGPLVYTTLKLPGNEGMLARGCVAVIPQGHVVLTTGDVIVHAGQGPKSIINARLRKNMFGNIDSLNYKRAFVTANPGRNEVWVCIPIAGDTAPSIAYIWNYVDDTWTTRGISGMTYGAVGQISATAIASWDTTTGMWDNSTDAWNTSPYPPTAARMLTVSNDSKINIIDRSALFRGAAFISTLERKGLPIGSASQVKTVNAIEPRFDAAAGTQVQIEIGASMSAESLPIYSAPITYTVGSSYRAFGFATGRFPAIRFTSLDNQFWRLKSYDVHYTEGGSW